MAEIETRELQLIRTFKTTLDQMWEVWTKPDHITQWWGPSGFTSTIHKMDFQEG